MPCEVETVNASATPVPGWALFSPDEQACISAKIAKLKGEGKPDDQAQAIAVRTCAPEKATSRQLELYAEAELPATEGFDATRSPEGTWTIHDVPVFSAHVDERPTLYGGEPEAYDERWLADALARGQRREQEDGYLGPLHVHHHPSDKVADAGRYRLTRVAPMVYDGEPTPTLFADLLEIPDEVYQDLKAGRLPYRSVELPNPKLQDAREVLSIALLSTDVPYFRYANMRIRREKRLRANGKRSALVARCYSLDGAETEALTFSFGTTQEAPVPTATIASESPKAPARAASPVPATSPAPAPASARMEGPDAKGRMAQLLRELLALVEGGAPEEADATMARAAQPAAVPPPPQPATGPVELPMTVREAQLAGQLAALQTRMARSEAHQAGAADRAQLVSFGVDPQVLAEYDRLVAGRQVEVARAYAAGYRTSFGAAPPATPPAPAAEVLGTAAPMAPGVRPGDAPGLAEVLKALAPDRHAHARDQYAVYTRGTRVHSYREWYGFNHAPELVTATAVNGRNRLPLED